MILFFILSYPLISLSVIRLYIAEFFLFIAFRFAPVTIEDGVAIRFCISTYKSFTKDKYK